MRTRFDEQLDSLNRDIIEMGGLCEATIAAAAKSLVEGDIVLAKQVQEYSERIDEKEREIEATCIKLLLQQHPVASDLRIISSALKMVMDMERIGDQSADIAEIVTMANIKADDDTLGIDDMAKAVIKMVTDSIDAFVKRDVAIAESVIAYDDVVDGHFRRIKQILVERLKKPEYHGEFALDLLMISKYFERIGDHAVNVAGWVLYSVTGSREGKNAPDMC